MSNSQNQVFYAIENERKYQDSKWGSLEERGHEVGSWLTIMRVCLAKAELAYTTQNGDTAAIDEIRQVIATGVACLEQHGIVYRENSL